MLYTCVNVSMHNYLCIINLDTSTVRFVSKREKVSRYLTAGRIQIFFAGRWGTICSNGFTSSDARRLCHILTGSSSVLAYGAVGDHNLE